MKEGEPEPDTVFEGDATTTDLSTTFPAKVEFPEIQGLLRLRMLHLGTVTGPRTLSTGWT
jgi:hypothetical protein